MIRLALHKIRLSSWQTIVLGYLLVIFLGSFCLSLPIASREGAWQPYLNALFTSVSATCVTGLIVYDTFSHWTLFGQIIILSLIQIGGIGFMTIFTLLLIFLKKKISIYERKLLMQTSSSTKISGVVQLVKRIIIGTLIFEGIGCALLMIRFIPAFGFGRGIFFSVFHSVSAFCNAGFDLMGINGEFGSLTGFRGDILVNLTICFLIVAGGLGFVVWNDVWVNRGRLKRLTLYTKIVFITTAVFITTSTLLFYFFEKSAAMQGMPAGEAWLASFFQSVTTRTAGFNTVDMNALSDSGFSLSIFLMFIGGSTGSTAGGIKITTFVAILFGVLATARNSNDIRIGKRSLDLGLMREAVTIMSAYLFFVFTATLIICAAEPVSIPVVVFEAVSAIGTVGLSTGITPSLGVLSKLTLIFLMFVGRVGVITLALAFTEKRNNPPIKRPLDKFIIG